MRFSCLFFLCATFLAPAFAATPPLLEQAAEKWLGERDNWAFTMTVREFDGGRVKEERRERYDPSRPGLARWSLLLVDGQPPSSERRAEWLKHKTKKRKNPGKPLNQYVDFERATIVRQDARSACYDLPLRNNHRWLFPVEKVSLRVTINKANLALEEIVAGIDEPFKVVLGFARVLDIDFDVQLNPPGEGGDEGNPAAAKPDGTARAVVNKWGERIEYAWSEFQRVIPHPENLIGESRGN